MACGRDPWGTLWREWWASEGLAGVEAGGKALGAGGGSRSRARGPGSAEYLLKMGWRGPGGLVLGLLVLSGLVLGVEPELFKGPGARGGKSSGGTEDRGPGSPEAEV